MNSERWQQISRLCHEARKHPEPKREAFLAQACGGDESLRDEVVSLLHQQAPDRPPSTKGLPSLYDTATVIGGVFVGHRLGHYDIHALLGVGGMGEVYRARDLRLERDVALKVLPSQFANDHDRMARFQREARVLAKLNHPNIGAIYGFEDVGGVPALVLELVEGETLAQRLQTRGTLSLDEVLTIACQVAGALAAAHDKGIIHRDLKPANIKIAPNGTVKVLDFGLAKVVQTLTVAETSSLPGLIVGTVPYMSPEQARGAAVDHRTDIWAFGCLLYEMLSGRAAFARGTTAETFAAVLEGEVDWTCLPTGTSPELAGIIGKTLERNPEQRYYSTTEVLNHLERLGRHLPTIRAYAPAGIRMTADTPAMNAEADASPMRTAGPPRGGTTRVISKASREWAPATALVLLAILLSAAFYGWQSRGVPRREIESLLRFYEDRAIDVQRELNQAVGSWRNIPASDPEHAVAQSSIAFLESKRSRFTELHQRHMEALRAGQLTLAQLYAQLANELLTGKNEAYSSLGPSPNPEPTESRPLRPSTDYPEQPAHTLDLEELTKLVADGSTPANIRGAAAEQVVGRCDASPNCVRALVAIFDAEGLTGLWEQAGRKLCEVGRATSFVPSTLVKVLASRSLSRVLELSALLTTLKCLGYADPAMVPHLVTIVEATVADNSARSIRRVAMQLLGDLGPTAVAAVPVLRRISESGDPDSREIAVYALERIER